jgi:hypothetical protein
MNKEVAAMKGIHLNDIPVDLFLEYFTSQDLANKTLTRKLRTSHAINNYTLLLSGGDLDEETIFYSSVSDYLDGLLENVKRDTADLGTFTSYSQTAVATSSQSKVYRNTRLEIVYPYRYRALKLNDVGNIDDEYFDYIMSADVTGTTLLTIKDSRTGLNIFTDVSFTESNGTKELRDSGQIVGYLYENEEYEVQEVDPSGNFIYIDEDGQETTDGTVNRFSAHQKAIRVGFNGFRSTEEQIVSKFAPRVIGLVEAQEGNKDSWSLMYYDRYNTSTTYERITITELLEDTEAADSDPVVYKYDTASLPGSITGPLEEIGDTVSLPVTSEYERRTVLELSAVSSVKAYRTTSGFIFNIISDIASVQSARESGQPILVYEYRREAQVLDSTYTISSSDKITFNGSSVDLIMSDRVFRIPVSLESGRYLVDINGTKYYARSLSLPIQINGSTYSIYPSAEGYQYGFILFPFSIVTRTLLNAFIAKVFSISGSAATLTNYSASIPAAAENPYSGTISSSAGSSSPYAATLTLTGELYDFKAGEKLKKISGAGLLGTGATVSTVSIGSGSTVLTLSATTAFTNGAVEFIKESVVSISYFRDSYDDSIAVKVTSVRTLQSQSIPSNELTEYDHYHVRVAPNSSYRTGYMSAVNGEVVYQSSDSKYYQFTAPSTWAEFTGYNSLQAFSLGTYDRIVRKSTSPNTGNVDTLDTFKQRYVEGRHFIQDGYLMSRGRLVPQGSFERKRREAIRKMSAEFIDKTDSFLVIDNVAFDTNAIMKMRVYSEGFQSLLKSDAANFNAPLSREGRRIQLSSLGGKIVALDSRTGQQSPNIKTYSADLSYVSDKMSELNTVQRLRDYNYFPTDTLREEFLAQESVRNQAFTLGYSGSSALDETMTFTKDYSKNKLSKSEFRDRLADDLVNNFYSFSAYYDSKSGALNDRYALNFTRFYRDKLSEAVVFFPSVSLDAQGEKSVYSSLYFSEEQENDLIEKILEKSRDTDWRIL